MKLHKLPPVKSFFAHWLTRSHFLTSRGSWLAITLLLAGLGLGAGIAAQEDGMEDNAEVLPAGPAPVEAVTLAPIDGLDIGREFTGVIKAARTSELGFERAARLVEVLVDVGEQVAQGQVLAKLDIRHLDTRQRELEAQRDQAQAVLDELQAGPRQERLDAARAQVNEYEADLRRLESNLQRQEKLVASHTVTREEYDQVRFNTQAAAARLENAQRQLDELQAGTRKEQIAAQGAAVAQLDGMLADLQEQRHDSVLTAPYSGTIAARLVDEGSVVTVGLPILTLVESDRLEAWIGVPPEAAAQLTVGQACQLKSREANFACHVGHVLPVLDAVTRTRTVVFELPSTAGGQLAPGQLARVEITQRQETSGVVVPLDALVRGSRGLWSVLAIVSAEEGSLYLDRRDVEVLHTDGATAVVRGTVQAGERIVAGGTHRLVAGQLVRVIDADKDE